MSSDGQEQQQQQQQPPASPSRRGFFGIGKDKIPAGDGTKTPSHEIAQTPAMESSNPMDKLNIPSEARTQQIVGNVGDA